MPPPPDSIQSGLDIPTQSPDIRPGRAGSHPQQVVTAEQPFRRRRGDVTHHGPEPPAHPVAHHRGADTATHGKSQAWWIFATEQIPKLHQPVPRGKTIA